uniref:Vinorine synthase-like n=1 Tax=Tanacetum cinerariifolium TaxID=118510 RepID=A0A6L2MFT2_TANCI|nr:vinorine synthase-like [Tanacetum cinerariifolium]
MSVTHKIFDGHTYLFFMKAWAAAARGSPERMSPSFVASQVFPNNPSFKYSWPSNFTSTDSIITKRFLFDSVAIAALKAQPVHCTGLSTLRSGPTRAEATSSLIWKVVAKASSIVRSFGPQSPHALFSYTLTRFYPIAGEVKNNLNIECNDKGVNFMEARVNQSLKEFLRQPDDKKVRELVPNSPRTGESSIGNYVMGVQIESGEE